MGGGGLRIWNLKGYQRNDVELPLISVFGLEISKGSKHNFVEYQELSCVLSGISRGKVKNKFQVGFQKSISLTPPVWTFSGIAHSNKQTNQV